MADATTYGDGLVHYVAKYSKPLPTACGIPPYGHWASRTDRVDKMDKITCPHCRQAVEAQVADEGSEP